MANNDQNEEPKQNEEPVEEQVDGLTAEEAAGVRPYDEVEVWKKSKNTLFSVLGIIALGVAISSFYNDSKEEESAERSLRFLNASLGEVGSEEKFLSFAEDYGDTLGGVAQYRAASIQYGDSRFAESAKSFLAAASRLAGDPLLGRAKIGHAVSLVKDDQQDDGRNALVSISNDPSLLNIDRFEARYLLGVDALGNSDEEGYEAQRKALSEDLKAADYLSRLVEYERLNRLYKQAKSLPEINLAKSAEYLSKQRKQKNTKETESGLLYQVLKKGDGDQPTAEDEVEVHYHGTLIDGSVFDSSRDRGEPAKFKVGQVIAGWTEALQLMKVGAKWKLFIPSELAYGKRGNNSIGPSEALTFEVELLGITPPIVEPELPDLNNSEPLPAVFPEDENQSNKSVPVQNKPVKVEKQKDDKDGNSSK
jgi:FKBP-type peptidyl-prolyl cis-trans isomerase FklB